MFDGLWFCYEIATKDIFTLFGPLILTCIVLAFVFKVENFGFGVYGSCALLGILALLYTLACV